MTSGLDNQLLEQVLFHLTQSSERQEQTLLLFRIFGSNVAATIVYALLFTIPLLLLAVFFYRPRLMRGSLWLPFFGLFGGTPTLYMHSRPTSLGGRFWKSLRRRSHSSDHRV